MRRETRFAVECAERGKRLQMSLPPGGWIPLGPEGDGRGGVFRAGRGHCGKAIRTRESADFGQVFGFILLPEFNLNIDFFMFFRSLQLIDKKTLHDIFKHQ